MTTNGWRTLHLSPLVPAAVLFWTRLDDITGRPYLFAEMEHLSNGKSLSTFVPKEKLMSDDAKKDMYSRRGFLGIGSAALAAAGMLSVTDAGGQEQHPYPTKSDKSASAPGPGNPT